MTRGELADLPDPVLQVETQSAELSSVESVAVSDDVAREFQIPNPAENPVLIRECILKVRPIAGQQAL
jgi:hypothetical protein